MSSESFANTLLKIADDKNRFLLGLGNTDTSAHSRVTARMMIASYDWFVFQLKFTAGIPVEELANLLDGVLVSFEDYARELKFAPNP